MNTIKSTILLGLFMILSACGSSKQSISNEGSTNSPYLLAGSAVGKCSIDMSNQPDFGMKLQAYESASEGLRSDLIRIKFIRVPNSFSDSDASSLQLWTRTIDRNGNWGSWQNIRFYFEFKNANGQVFTTPYAYQDMTWRDMKLVASSFGLNVSDASNFFSQIQLVVQLDINSNAKTITAALYPNGGNTSQHITALAPIFDANPKNYQANQPQALVALHPLQNLLNTSFSNSQFEFEMNKFCF